MTNGRSLLVNIQFLRFIAALAVVAYHFASLLPAGGAHAIQVPASIGFAGVDVFFVISGFILWNTVQRRRGSAVALRFLKHRLARIFTGYWPYLVLALLLFWYFEPTVLATKNIFGSVFLAPIALDSRVLAVSWTLTHELYFYLLFFALLFVSEPIGHRAIYALAAAVLLINLIGMLFFGFYQPQFFDRTTPLLRVLISPYTLEFLAGSLLCRWHLAGVRKGGALPAAALALMLFAAGCWYNLGPANGALGDGAHVVERVLLLGSAAVLLIYAAVDWEVRGWAALPAFSRLFGGASYSLYLSHTLLLSLYGWLGFTWMRGGSVGIWLAMVGLVITYSTLHYLAIEHPAYRASLRWLE